MVFWNMLHNTLSLENVTCFEKKVKKHMSKIIFLKNIKTKRTFYLVYFLLIPEEVKDDLELRYAKTPNTGVKFVVRDNKLATVIFQSWFRW